VRAGTRLWLALIAAACADPGSIPAPARVPASMVAITTPTASVVAGTAAGTVSVKVLDASGAPVSGVVVTFTVSRGGGLLGTAAMRTAGDGVASSTFRASTAAGLNEVTAFVTGVASLTFTVTGTPGATRTIVFGQRSLRYSTSVDSLIATAGARDTFANAVPATISWVARDSTLVSVAQASPAAAAVRVLRRPGLTWLIATNGAAVDSLAVMVWDSTSTPCTYQATPIVLPLGGVQQFDSGLLCIRSAVAGAEYAVVAHLGTAAYAVSQSFEVVGDGIAAPTAFPDQLPAVSLMAPSFRDAGFERRMRAREAQEIVPRLASARSAIRQRTLMAPGVGAASNILPAQPQIGQVMSLNVNATDFCGKVDPRKGRVAAVSNSAIIIADLANPEGGFTDAEYQAFAAHFDTLITPIDTGAFGAPTDIDNNGRVAVFFTKAVNELTPPGSTGGVVLGFYYLRDLLPRESAFGACPGSNAGEMFYLLVPDPFANVNENPRSKAFVSSTIVATLAHEYQHLINASRRMYVTDALRVDEDVWLNEGLSHIAEELVFYRASGLAPRANIGGGPLAMGTPGRDAFDAYQRSNFGRYQQYLRSPEGNSPLAGDDELATRGATWSFLRYLADRVRPADGDFWRKLVNSRWTGVVNLDSVLAGTGTSTIAALRDWSTAVIADDSPSAPSVLQQPSWNFRSAFPAAGGSLSFALTPRVLFNGLSTAIGVVGGGSSYLRFGVAQDREALIRVGGLTGSPLPSGMRLTVVRIK
jgi:hypothetical protein